MGKPSLEVDWNLKESSGRQKLMGKNLGIASDGTGQEGSDRRTRGVTRADGTDRQTEEYSRSPTRAVKTEEEKDDDN